MSHQALEIPFALPADPPPAMAQTCEHCGGDFVPRTGSGGKPQRFCSPDCRTAFHERQRSQQGPTCVSETQPKAIAVQPAQINEPAATPDDDAFKWNDDSTILPEQQAIAVYFNRAGDLVIRQERSWDRDEDSFVFVARDSISAFIDRLTNHLGYGSGP